MVSRCWYGLPFFYSLLLVCYVHVTLMLLAGVYSLLQALALGGTFSCIWQTQPGTFSVTLSQHDVHVYMWSVADSRPIGETGKATFKLQYKPLIAEKVQ